MKTRSALLSFFSLAILATTGCSSESSTSHTPPNEPPPERTYCEVTELGCKRQIECGAVVFNHALTESDCVAESECASFTKEELAALGVSLDVAALDACLAKLGALSCGEVAALRGGFGPALAVCGRLTKGSVAEGGACGGLVFDDCAPGLTCTFDGETCPGRCAAKVEACTQDSCGADEYCSYATGRCASKAGLGGACELNLVTDPARRTCVAGTYCAFAEGQGSTCQPVVAKGASCAACQDPSCCEDGYYCSFETQTCVARAAPGEACSSAPSCREDLYCDFTSNVCKTPGAEGAACDDSEGACALGFVCSPTTHRCAREGAPEPATAELVAEHGACHRASVCAIGLACVDASGALVIGPDAAGTCEKRLGQPGATCEASFDAHACASRLCNFATGTCPTPLETGATCAADGIDTACPLGICLGGKCAAPADLTCLER